MSETPLNDTQLRTIVREAVRETVNQTTAAQREMVREVVRHTLVELGIDVSDPHEMQRDFKHLREWRESMEQVRSKSILAVIGLVVSGLVAAVWIGLKHFLGSDGA